MALRRGAIAVGGLVLVACSSGDDGSPNTNSPVAPRELPQVLERFNVGDDAYVRALTVDHQADSIWVGTSVGVHEISLKDHTALNTFTRKDGLANEYVFAVGIAKDGAKWFGTNAGGVSRYQDGEWQTFFPMHGLADYWVYSFANQSDGTLWIGTWAGANSVDPDTRIFTTYIKELINEWVYGLVVDSKDRVWFGTEGGISMFDGKEWRSWDQLDGLGGGNSAQLPPSRNTGLGTRSRHDLGVLSGGMATYNPNYVFSLHMTADDVLWAGTWGGGVSRFDGTTWSTFTVKDGLAGDIVYAATQDQEGTFWFGTNGGVSRYDGQRWTNYRVNPAGAAQDVYTLAVAPSGEIWAGSRGGVARIGVRPISPVGGSGSTVVQTK